MLCLKIVIQEKDQWPIRQENEHVQKGHTLRAGPKVEINQRYRASYDIKQE